MKETYQLNSSLPTIKSLNLKIIDESYNIERTLLSINIGDEAATLDKYNSGNLCNFISEYQNSGIFTAQFDANECINLKQGILLKGIKTSIVTML